MKLVVEISVLAPGLYVVDAVFESAVMFLKWDKTRKGYTPVVTGIKRLRKTDVLRYEQFRNPGPLVLSISASSANFLTL